ncbi:MAG TPA: hypothetical protein VI756_07510 [Blastocatellia bacterium]
MGSNTSSSITATYNSSSEAATLTIGSQSGAAIVKNIVTDFGCGCNGVDDDNAAFHAFNSWALNWQENNTGLIELYIPPGSTPVVTSGSAGHAFAAGIQQLLVVGYGATLSDGGSGDGFFLGGLGVEEDNAHSARVATVPAGSNSVTLLTPGQSSLFSVGNWALMAGLDMMGYGYPPDPAFFDYVQVSAVNSETGVITFGSSLQNSYESTWPLYNGGSSYSTDLGGPATLYSLDPTWNAQIEYRGLTLSSSGLMVAVGKNITFTDITCTGGGSVYPSENLTWTAVNLNDSGTNIQMDKLVGTVTITNATIGSIDFQSSSINSLVMTGSTITNYLHGTPKTTTISNSTMGEFWPGAWGYGASNEVTCTNCVINSPLTPLGSQGPAWGTYTMSDGILTVPNSAGPANWAVPGASVYLSGSQDNEYSARVIDLTQDATNTYIQTSIQGGYPTIPAEGGATTMFKAYPMTAFTCTNCTGDPTAVDASQAPPGNPFYSYAHRTYTGNIYTNQSIIPVWGNMVEIKIIVTTPYTGALSNLALSLGPGGVLVMNSSGANVGWNPTINLRVPGERDIFPDSVAGVQAGDLITAPGPIRLFDDEFQPLISSNIGGEASSVYPSVTVEIITDGGLGSVDESTAISSFSVRPGRIGSAASTNPNLPFYRRRDAVEHAGTGSQQ